MQAETTDSRRKEHLDGEVLLLERLDRLAKSESMFYDMQAAERKLSRCYSMG